MKPLKLPYLRSLFLAGTCCLTTAAQSPTLSELSDLLRAYRAEGAPGGVLAAEVEGELAHLEAFGQLRSGQAEEITADTRFYIASTAKMFTASCVHLLAADGKLALDDELGMHLPELARAAPGVTLRQMLHHRSGIRDFYEMGLFLGWDLEEPPAREEVVALIARQKGLNFAPGSSGSYSNSNYLLLSMVVEKVAGKPFSVFAEEELFAPLDMTNTAFGLPAAGDSSPRATAHVRREDGFEASELRNRLVGAGGAWSTAQDLLRFARIFTDEQWSELATALSSDAGLDSSQWLDPQLGDYRAGVMHRDAGGMDLFLHPGGYMGAQAILLVVPELGMSVALVTNREDLPVSNMGMDAAARLGLEQSETVEASAASGTPPSLRVLLRGRSQRNVALLSIQGKRGVFQGLGINLDLSPVDATTLRAKRTRFPVQVALSDDRRSVELRSPGKDPLVYEAIEMDSFSAEDAEDCVGVYYSEELGGELELIAKGNQLAILDQGYAFVIPPFRSLSRDVHVSAGRVMLLIEFERDDDGEVTGLRLGTNRAQGLHFQMQ